jgi:hypothetical protein
VSNVLVLVGFDFGNWFQSEKGLWEQHGFGCVPADELWDPKKWKNLTDQKEHLRCVGSL